MLGCCLQWLRSDLIDLGREMQIRAVEILKIHTLTHTEAVRSGSRSAAPPEAHTLLIRLCSKTKGNTWSSLFIGYYLLVQKSKINLGWMLQVDKKYRVRGLGLLGYIYFIKHNIRLKPQCSQVLPPQRERVQRLCRNHLKNTTKRSVLTWCTGLQCSAQSCVMFSRHIKVSLYMFLRKHLTQFRFSWL